MSMKWPVLALIRFYQRAISPGLGASCRFEPSCSAYAYGAISRFGVLRGCWLAARRLMRCRPGSAGGFDPVPGDTAGAESPAPPDKSGSRHAA